MFVRLSVCLSVCMEQACIVITWCILARILAYGWIVKCYGHPDTKAYLLTPSRFFSSTWEGGRIRMCKLGVISQERLKIHLKLLYWIIWVVIGSHKCRVDWHNNGWPWVTLDGRHLCGIAELLVVDIIIIPASWSSTVLPELSPYVVHFKLLHYSRGSGAIFRSAVWCRALGFSPQTVTALNRRFTA